MPRRLGATVEIQRATGREPELLRHRTMLDAVCRADFSHPQTRFSGRGIVICAGGERYLPSVYVLVRLLRHLRCTLPVEVWHLGPREMPERMRVLLGEHGAVCVDAEAMRRVHPARRLGGWELKCYALLHSSFAEVLLLDADNCPVRNPEFLFRTPQYAQHGAAADALSRPDALKEGSTKLCSYRYLGAGVVIGVKYDAASNLELTFEDGGTGGAGDPYTGLDRFGRLVQTLWKKGSDKPVRSKYGRNEFGGVVWRRDEEAHAQTPSVSTEDNYYWYDGLYQVKERQRGNLTGTPPYTGIGSLQQKEDWTYDATGNWAAYADTNPANSQTRTHNKANEITQIASPTVAPGYDPAGNMLTLPRNPGGSTAQYALTWDAWNRLVSVKDGSTPVASYTYDGLTRRLTKTIPVSGGPDEVRHYYYNNQWRALEERVGASVADRQYTWGLRDRWDMLRRKRSVNGGSLKETHYVLRDYLDPVALADATGAVVERYAYDAFGVVRFLDPDFAARDASEYDWDFLFHAEFLDPDTEIYNYGYRYYSPTLGRWLSRDPIQETGGLNLFGMAGNNPVNYQDYLGQKATVTVDENCCCKLKVKLNVTFYVPSVYERGITVDNSFTTITTVNTEKQRQSTLKKLKAIAQRFKDDVEKAWNKAGRMHKPCKIVFSVTTETSDSANRPPLRDNAIAVVEHPDHRSYTTQGNGGVYRAETTTSDMTTEHEAGHLMGLKDRYDPKTGRLLPNGKNTMMGELKPVTQDELEELLRVAKSKCPPCCEKCSCSK